MQLILQVVSGSAEDLERVDASRLIIWISEGQSVTVGRSDKRADFAVFQDARMSSSHFLVTCASDGCNIRDMGSTNGTVVNGSPIQQSVLRNGDVILAGETVFNVRIEGEKQEFEAKRTHSPVESIQLESAGVGGDEAEAGSENTDQPNSAAFDSVPIGRTESQEATIPTSEIAVHAAIKIQSGPFSRSEAVNLTRLIHWVRPGETLSFGRTKDRSDVAIRQDERLTSLHFEIECDGRVCLLRDMGSRNGTFLNDIRIEEAELENGDTIRAGTTSFVVRLVECEPTGRPLGNDHRFDSSHEFSAHSPSRPKSQSVEEVAFVEKVEEKTTEPMRVVLMLADAVSVGESRVMSWFGAGQSITVGRAADKAEMAIGEDQLMSGAHFEVSCDGHRCRLRDLGSRNGTYVNGQPVSEVVVSNGDKILAGRTKFTVNIVGGTMAEQTLDFDTGPLTIAETEKDTAITIPDIDAILAGVQTTPLPQPQSAKDTQELIDSYLPSANVVQERIAKGQVIDGSVLSKLDLKGVDLRDARITNCTLIEVDFEGAVLRSVDFHDSVFVRVNFSNADLTGANLNGTSWSETKACRAKLHKADLSNSTMISGQAPVSSDDEVEITFTDAKVPASVVPEIMEAGVHGFAWRPNDFTGADLRTCQIQDAFWDHARVGDAKFVNAKFANSRFSCCDFSGSAFKRTRLDYVEFEDCVLKNVDLSTSYLKGVHFKKMDLSEHPILPRVLTECGFSDCTITGRDLSFCNLRDADLTRVDLTKVKLIDAQLRGANLQECDLTGVRLVGVDLTGANFTGARLVGADLTDSNLTGADLSGADMKAARLSRALLKNTKLRKTNLDGAALVDAMLDHAELLEASLAGADMRGAKLEAVDLSKVDFTTIDLGNTSFLFCLLKETSFKGMDLTKCSLRGCNIGEGDLSGASLEKVDCRQANFEKANLTGTNFQVADCDSAKFMKCNAADADFSDANLFGANFEDAVATRAKLTNAKLEKARLVQADFTDAIFCRAQLPFADLSKAILTNADFENANLTQANLHLTEATGTRWLGTKKRAARGTDKDRAAAESWQPPQPKEKILPMTPATRT
ncbi:MAG: pentapeptide repeat-containing protein [Pirellulaceae bacterium]